MVTGGASIRKKLLLEELLRSKSEASPEPICWRCGEAGHIRYNNATGARCHASVCTLCHSNIGEDLHDARVCCNRSHQVFAGRNFKSSNQGKREKNNASSTQPKGKRGKKNFGKEKVPTTMVLGIIILLQLLLLLHLFPSSYSKREL